MGPDTRVAVWGGLSFLVLVAAACGNEAATPPPPPVIGAAGAPSTPGVAGSPQTMSPVATAGSPSIPTAAAGSNASAAGSAAVKPPDIPPGMQMVPGVPCDVASVVSENCTTCHAATPMFAAPMPLMKHADFHAMAKTNPARKVYEITPARLNATDIKLRMPPASGKAIPAAGLDAFNKWLAAGAVATTPSCEITAKGTTPAMPAAGSGAVEPGMPRSGGATNVPQKYDDPLMKCYEFRAHAGDKKAPYMVGTSPDMYTNFTFMPPWQGVQYARSMRVLTGNTEIIHHWLFYKDLAAVVDGGISPSIGAHPTGELMHGWAPGGSDLYLDPDVGLELPGDIGYTLETHHNNTTGGAKPDNSGIEVCVTPTQPKHVASLSWLGTDNLNGTTAQGTCTPLGTEPIHIIGIQPHMHLKGKHMKAVIRRNSGMMETLHDEPFDFEYQHSYDTRTILMPGESITTTCSYTGPVRFGEGTNDEMCYMFTLYYPKLSLTNGNPVATLIHGPNTCLQ